MNKILAIDPRAIEDPIDWVKIYPFVGHERGLFMANFPKYWKKEFLSQDFDPSIWGFRELEQMKELLILLQESNKTPF
jgi:hypothetical protein